MHDSLRHSHPVERRLLGTSLALLAVAVAIEINQARKSGSGGISPGPIAAGQQQDESEISKTNGNALFAISATKTRRIHGQRE
jgi:hypothetical protein